MAENSLNRVFIKPAEKEKEEAGNEETRFDRERVEKMVAGMNSGDFGQAAKAYAMFDRVSNNFEQAVKALAMFDRMSKNMLWEGERA